MGDGNIVGLRISSNDIETIYDYMKEHNLSQKDAERKLAGETWEWFGAIAALNNIEKIANAMQIGGNMIFTGCGLGRGANLGNSLRKRIGTNVNIYFNADYTTSYQHKAVEVGLYKSFIFDNYLSIHNQYEYGWVKFPVNGERVQVGNIRLNSSGDKISFYEGVYHIQSKVTETKITDGRTGKVKKVEKQLVDTSYYEKIATKPLP